jgi:hypothetical protein
MPGGGEVNYVHAETIWRQRLDEETRAAAEWHGNWGFLANKPQPPPRGFSTRTAKYTYGGSQWTLQQTRVPDSSEQGVAAAVAERDARKRMSSLTWESKLPNITQPCSAHGAYTGIKLVESALARHPRTPSPRAHPTRAHLLALQLLTAELGDPPSLHAPPFSPARYCENLALTQRVHSPAPSSALPVCLPRVILCALVSSCVSGDTSGVKTREQALLMRTHMFQTLGDACRTAGVDPAEKYRAPVTAAHEVGWQVGRARSAGARPTLEIFGVSEHGIKGRVGKFN